MDAFEEMVFKMNEKNLHSELVKQDVLILTGRNDRFIPFKANKMQVRALTNAKSVTAKVFTKETHANNHCQIGNKEYHDSMFRIYHNFNVSLLKI